MTSKYCKTLEKHTGQVNSVAFHYKGNLLASGGKDGRVCIWNCAHQKLIQEMAPGNEDGSGFFYGHKGPVNDVSWSRKGRKLSSASDDSTVKIWKTHLLKQRGKGGKKRFSKNYTIGMTLKGDDAVECVDASVEKGNPFSYVAGTDSGNLNLWAPFGKVALKDKIEERPATSFLKGHKGSVLSVTANGKRIVSGGEDNTIKVWNNKLIKSLDEHKGPVRSVVYTRNENVFVSCSDDGTIKVWDNKGLKCLHTISTGSPVYSVDVNKNGKKIVSGGKDGRLKVWDSLTGKCLYDLKGHSDEIHGVAFNHKTDKVVASGSKDKTVKLWVLSAAPKFEAPAPKAAPPPQKAAPPPPPPKAAPNPQENTKEDQKGKNKPLKDAIMKDLSKLIRKIAKKMIEQDKSKNKK